MQISSYNILKGRGAVALAALCNRRNEDCNVLANSVGQLFICYSENILYVCNVLHTQRRDDARQQKAGFFYARTLNNSGSVPPCMSIMDILPLRCKTTGKAGPFFYIGPNINFTEMSYSEKKQNLSILKERWAVAELQVSYKPKQKTGVKITVSHDAYQVFLQMWDNSLINIQEQFACLFLNQASEVIGYRLITTGKATSNTIDFNFIITCALLCRAQRVIFAHNHPSGSTKPSKADKDVTFAAKWKLEPFEVDVTDHLIITDGDYYSFIDNGLILKN